MPLNLSMYFFCVLHAEPLSRTHHTVFAGSRPGSCVLFPGCFSSSPSARVLAPAVSISHHPFLAIVFSMGSASFFSSLLWSSSEPAVATPMRLITMKIRHIHFHMCLRLRALCPLFFLSCPPFLFHLHGVYPKPCTTSKCSSICCLLDVLLYFPFLFFFRLFLHFSHPRPLHFPFHFLQIAKCSVCSSPTSRKKWALTFAASLKRAWVLSLAASFRRAWVLTLAVFSQRFVLAFVVDQRATATIKRHKASLTSTNQRLK